MDNEIMTVSDLLEFCKKLDENGYGNMPIKCQDVYLHKDEITTNYNGEGYMQFTGYLFHQDLAQKMREFQKDFKKAVDKFYEREN